MREHRLLAPDVDLKELAALTNNYSGAEIESVARSATSFALFEGTPELGGKQEITKKEKKFERKIVKRSHFMRALEEIKPQFGVDD